MVTEIGRYEVDWIEVVPFVEDIEPLAGTPWLVASGVPNPIDRTPGRLYLVNTEDDRVFQAWPGGGTVSPSGGFEISEPVEIERFAPHGIALGECDGGDGSWNLYAVHHGVRESIEVFRLTLEGDGLPTTAWIGAIARRPDTEGNAVAALPDGGVIASHYTPQLTFKPELHDGRMNGGVERWTPEEGWTPIEGLDGAMPNGVAVSADGGTYFLADTLAGLRRSTSQGTDLTHIRLPLAPDNLKWGEDGRLLTTGVRPSSLDRAFAAIADRVLRAVQGEPDEQNDDLVMPESPEPVDVVVVAIDPVTLEVETLLDEHAPLGVPTTAVSVEGQLYLTSLFDKRLARLRVRA